MESPNEQMSYCPTLGLLILGDRPGLGTRKTPRRADHRQVESTYKHHRPIKSINTAAGRQDSSFQREYWEPCNSTFREYIVNGCTGN